jgi:hypothetical protein
MIRSFLIGLLVVVCGGGCSGSLAPPKPDGSSDAAVVCPSVDTASYCQSWTALVTNPSCGNEFDGGRPNIHSYQDCGPYHVQVVTHVDTFEAYYYDIATGACVAAYSGNGEGGLGASNSLCLAGPSAGIAGPCGPGGSGPWTPTTGICPDGGAGGGAGAGGGSVVGGSVGGGSG